ISSSSNKKVYIVSLRFICLSFGFVETKAIKTIKKTQ
ncbi:Uncharacterized protein TCM_037904 isoform 2, partial [Theobroma cacao]